MRYKIIFFSFIIVIGLVITLYSLSQIDRSRAIFSKIEQTAVLAQKIRYYDEVLSMSARMAAFNKDPKWIKRYNDNITPLDESIKKSILLTPQIKPELNKVDDANQKLIKIETKALEFAKNNNFKSAQELLFSNEYNKLKQIYSKGLENSIGIVLQINKELEKRTKKHLSYMEFNIVISILIIVIAIIYLYKILSRAVETEQYKRLLDLSSDGIYILDSKGNIVQCSESFANNLGYSLDEMKKLNLKDWEVTNDADKLISFQNTLIKELKSNIFETKHRKKDGTIIEVQINAKGITLEGSKYLLATQRDISEIKRKDFLLLEQSKMAALGEMIGNIAHQWRQPLNAISTAASSFKIYYHMKELDEKSIDKLSDTIINNSLYLSNTIDTFRDFIKGEKVLRTIPLQEEILEAKSIVSAVLKHKHIKLEDNINYNEQTMVTITTGELPQVLINIINNAKDIILEREIEEGCIKLDLIKKDKNITITIEDNAKGIPKDVLPKIFEPYFTTKHQSLGTGLGLHMSYRIITESLKGKIWAKNTKLGAKFFIEIPLSK